MTFRPSLINTIFPQQRKNPFDSPRQLLEDHSSQQTKTEQSKTGKAGLFQISKEGKYYFSGLAIFICVICRQGEMLRVPFTKITPRRKWEVLMVCCCSVHCLDSRNCMSAHSSPGLATCPVTSELPVPSAGTWKSFGLEACSLSHSSISCMPTMGRHGCLFKRSWQKI